jgi:hypothetical protein
MRLKCKKTSSFLEIRKNKYYEFIKMPFNKSYFIITKSGVRFLYFDKYYIWDYFYTKEELRIEKIKGILKD